MSIKGVKRERTLRALERAAMAYYRWLGKPPSLPVFDYTRPTDRLIAACAAHAAARKKERK